MRPRTTSSSDDAKCRSPDTIVIVVVAGHARPFWQRKVKTRNVSVTDVHPVGICDVVCVYLYEFAR